MPANSTAATTNGSRLMMYRSTALKSAICTTSFVATRRPRPLSDGG